MPHLPTFFTWYYASFDNNSHWATQLFLGVECSLISSFSLPGAFLNSCQISLESIRPIVEGDAEVEGMLRKNAQLRPGLCLTSLHTILVFEESWRREAGVKSSLGSQTGLRRGKAIVGVPRAKFRLFQDLLLSQPGGRRGSQTGFPRKA